MGRTFRNLAAAIPLVLLGACPGMPRIDGSASAEEEADDTPQPSGATCGGRADCPRQQVCVTGRCRHRLTAVRGEALAIAAKAQLEAGDVEGAVRAYEQAVTAFREAEAPIPADVVCRAADASLRSAGDQETREKAAKLADDCFRGSLPGDEARADLLRTVARLRYEGLALEQFDTREQASRFFTAQPSRPTVDAIEIALALPEVEAPGFNSVREALQAENATRAVADCFIQDWEIRHEREAAASLVLKLTSSLRDMGDYDAFPSQLEVSQGGLAQDGFEPCVAGALTSVLQAPNLQRVVAWQHPFAIRARLK